VRPAADHPRPTRAFAALVSLVALVGALVLAPAPAAASAAVLAPGSCDQGVAWWRWPLEQRVAQLLAVAVPFDHLDQLEGLAATGVGTLVLRDHATAGDGPTLLAATAAARAAAPLDPWIAVDEEGGDVTRLSALIGALPGPRALAATTTPADVRRLVAEHARAMRALGVDVDLAPVLDTAPVDSGFHGIVSRSFGDDPDVVWRYGSAFVAGLDDGGVLPVVKHFPGLGHATANTDLAPAQVPPLGSLRAHDLVPFERAVAAGIPVVMVGHPVVPDLTGGLPASLSPATYELLRGELGFAGVAMTDALGAVAVDAAGFDLHAAARTALAAGADVALLPAAGNLAPVRDALVADVRAGALPLARVDEALGRVLAAKGLERCQVTAVAAPSSPGGAGAAGAWLADAAGAVRSVDGAPGLAPAPGATAGHPAPVVALAARPGGGAWAAAADGAVLAMGGAPDLPGLGGAPLNQPVVGAASTPGGGGWCLVAADGGVFTAGDAAFLGSTGGIALNQPVVGMAPTPTGRGYWLVARDGGIFSFGDAPFLGSLGDVVLNQPIVAMAATPSGRGYQLVARDGGTFAFGDATYLGGLGADPPAEPVVGGALGPGGDHLWLAAAGGASWRFP
jgi:beta-N-acetylhexosaminidase